MTIRPYSPSDNESIITLLRLNTPEYFAPEEEADLRDYFVNHIDRYFVVEDSGNIIGCGGINFSEDRKKAVLSWDIIHPNYQGKGVGRFLTQHRLDTINQMDGIENISVRTSQLVYKFYEKFGFELKETVKDFWAEGIDMYRMEMK
jgi:N-acetylglutamate synthase-like GNAT family acetyltransferase